MLDQHLQPDADRGPVRRLQALGIGRENGHVALDQYSQWKSVYVEMGDVEAPY
jgi:hypothetical protein